MALLDLPRRECEVKGEDCEIFTRCITIGDNAVCPTCASFIGTIVHIANERVVTAEDFEPFVGRHNWLTIDADDMPVKWDLPGDRVCKFTLRRIFPEKNAVEILVNLDDLVPGGTAMYLDADELAIRMEDS